MKKQYTLNQLKDDMFRLAYCPDRLLWPRDYIPVAIVEIETTGDVEWDLEEVFRLTNSIDFYWGDSAQVVWKSSSKPGFRSTSVGDVIIVDRETVYRCAPCGFEKINLGPDFKETKNG